MRISKDNAHMKRRVNLTLDAKLVARARAVAHRQRTSVSQLVEEGLQRLTGDSKTQGKSFADRWMGKLRLAPRDPEDRKREYLWRKHKLSQNEDSDRH